MTVRVAVLVYDGVAELDVFSAYGVLARAGSGVCAQLAGPADAVTTSTGVVVHPTRDLAWVEQAAHVVVPGGSGAVLHTVCTGAVVLAGAGLGRDLRLAVHHGKRDQLRAQGHLRIGRGLLREHGTTSAGGDVAPSAKGADVAFDLLTRIAPGCVAELSERMELVPGRRVVTGGAPR